jgi:tetratricopeptide (TPR) repeat protein
VRPLLLALLLVAGCPLVPPSGAREGRQGNARLAVGDSEAAAERYRAGLERAEDGPAAAGLHHNLGLALAGEEAWAEVEAAAGQSLALARTPAERARAAYLAGNAALAEGRAEAALAHYRRALLEQPDLPEARFNYEFAARQEPPEPPEGGGLPPTPSPYARDLKARADALVAARRYPEALALMEEGALQDSTVLAYRDFMGRLGTVVGIEEGAGDQQEPSGR